MVDQEIQPEKPPALHLPQANSIVQVHIINSTAELVIPADVFVDPVLKGHETLNLPDYAFLIQNRQKGKSIMFDIGCRKDWWNLSPEASGSIKNHIPAVNVPKNVNEILVEGGVDTNTISSIIWSHWHWDHIGDASLFDKSTEIVVGPGFKDAFLPGYPAKPDSPVLEADFDGRTVREIEFNSQNRIGQFSSHDFFGDGSFYILDVPGHAVGHICALARTTPTTFVFMGGDVCHFGGSFRPTPYTPLPSVIPASTPVDGRFPSPCPCSIFTGCHPSPAHARTTPFYSVSPAKGSFYLDPKVSQQSVKKLEEFDACADVLVCLAHDVGLEDVCRFFPHGDMAGWKAEGWKERSRWGFLNELPVDGKPGRGWIANGLMRIPHAPTRVRPAVQ